MDDTLLKIKDLEIIYQTDLETVRAVNRISLEIKKGRTLGLVGETGAGKTTTCLAILRLLPDRTGKVLNGEILFKDQNLLTMKESKLRKDISGEEISMIFQDPMTSLNPVMTVGSQIFEALKYHNDDKRSHAELEKRVGEVLELVGIPARRANEYPHQFSGGMKQRVVIAMALACEPELLIADEPTTALDVTIQAQVLAMMKDLQNRFGSAILLITHDLGVVAQMCDDAMVMYAGEIVESGTAEDIYESEEHHPYTVGLFGSIPDLDKEVRRLTPIDGLMPDPTALPKGCYFADRCPYATDRCREEHPQPVHLSETHMIMCHRFDGKGGASE
ncbi:MAG: ABC transporter ATP-binding protein [Lachnospiraceae bacterium]|nr:ABC transporter ATP-binding protein [Lachnospiraceae bacterium]